MPKTSGPKAVCLLYDGLCTFEYGIAAEVFALERHEMGPEWYRFETAAIEEGPLRANGGVTVSASGGLELLKDADIVVIPGWRGVEAPVPPDLISQLRKAHERGARLLSLCSGAFVVAATGLLDGLSATTHWRYAESLRGKFPSVNVDEKALYREEGRLFTSAGSAAAIDLLIEIVRQDFGPDAANSVARRLVMPAHRSGDQSQFVEKPVAKKTGVGVATAIEQFQTDMSRDWTIANLAEACHMSRRTFERRFQEAVGTAPGKWMIAQRIEAAKDILITSKSKMDEVAHLVGFGDANSMRYQFRRHVGIQPLEYRERFSKVGHG